MSTARPTTHLLFCFTLIPPKQHSISSLMLAKTSIRLRGQSTIQWIWASIPIIDLKNAEKFFELRASIDLNLCSFLKGTEYATNIPFIIHNNFSEMYLTMYMVNEMELPLREVIRTTRLPIWCKIIPNVLLKESFPKPKTPTNPAWNFEIKKKRKKVSYFPNMRITLNDEHNILSTIKQEGSGVVDTSFVNVLHTMPIQMQMDKRELLCAQSLETKSFAKYNEVVEAVKKAIDIATQDEYSSISLEIGRVFSNVEKQIPLAVYVNRVYYITEIILRLNKLEFSKDIQSIIMLDMDAEIKQETHN